MNIMAILSIAFLLCSASPGLACEVYLSCEDVQAIHVGKGRRHIADGQIEVIYGATVLLEPETKSLKEAFASCPDDMIRIHLGDALLVVPKVATTPSGDWFGVDRPTPEQAVDAAMGLCPDKVIVHLPDAAVSDRAPMP